jgi:hypothetical protein
MNRPLVAVLVAALLAPGCFDPPPRVKADDPDALAAAIARKGRGEDPGEPVPPGSSRRSERLETAAKVGVICLFLPAYLAYEVLAARSDYSDVCPAPDSSCPQN